MRFFKRFLAGFAALALLAAVAPPAAAQQQAPDPLTANEVQTRLLEPRWLPWLGCWELVADAVDQQVVDNTGRRVVCVVPRLDGLGVNLTTQIDDKVIADNTVLADGAERPLPEAECGGYQTASWSADGRRLYSTVSASCSEDTRRTVTGMSMLVEGGRWVELQSVSLDGGEHRELVVRQYDRLDTEATRAIGYATLDVATAARAATARAAASAPLDVEDIIEAAGIFPVELIEATILESGTMFALDTAALVRLADAGIEDRVIDLMVAVSFPEQFVVDTGSSGGGGGMYVGYYGYGYGYYPNCWGRYYSPFYGPYGPGCGNFWYSPYYGYYRPPYYGGGGGYRPVVPPSGSLYGGKVVNGRGYSTPKVAVPTIQSGSQSGSQSIIPRQSGSGLGYTVRRAIPRNGVRTDGNGRTYGGKRATGGVSRSGFSKPSSSGGGSSSGSSSSGSSGSAKPRGGTAKPRGGGARGGSGS